MEMNLRIFCVIFMMELQISEKTVFVLKQGLVLGVQILQHRTYQWLSTRLHLRALRMEVL